MKLLVVILNYRVTELTIECLKSIEPEVARVPGMKVAVCENGTGGDAEQRLREAISSHHWDSWVDLSAIYPNRGFTGGCNFLIRQALALNERPEYFLLLNNDTIVHPSAFEILVRFMDQHPAVGIAGSRLEWPDGSPQGSPFRFQSIATELDRGLQLGIMSKLLSRWSIRVPTPDVPTKVDWVAGTSAIIRTSVIDEIGPLDEGLYTYFEDIDFCLNAARTKSKWETWFVPQSRVMHLEGASTGIDGKNLRRRPNYWYQARRRFFLKNHGPAYTALADAAFLAGFALWRLRRRIQRKPDTDPPHMLADSLSNSVFFTGFQLRDVPNPAIQGDASPGPGKGD